MHHSLFLSFFFLFFFLFGSFPDMSVCVCMSMYISQAFACSNLNGKESSGFAVKLSDPPFHIVEVHFKC